MKTINYNKEEKSPVSIIIPAYNNAALLYGTISSVLQQDYPALEVVVVDDGSTDNTVEILTSFGPNIRWVRQQNQGPSAARNRGVKEAKNQIIGFLDADDFYAPGYLDTLMQFWSTNPEYDAVYCGCRFTDVHGTLLPYVESHVVPPHELYRFLLHGNFLATHSLLIRKSCFEKLNGFDDDLKLCEDWDLWLRLSKTYNVAGIPDALAMRRVREGSISKDPDAMHRARVAVLNRHLHPETLSQKHTWQSIVYGQAHTTAAVDYLQAHNHKKAYFHIRQAFIIAPKLFLKPGVLWELALGDQPTGYRGELKTLNAAQNAAILMELLVRLFKNIPDTLRVYKEMVFKNTRQVLDLIRYGKGEIEKEDCHFPLHLKKINPLPQNPSFWDLRLQEKLKEMLVHHGV